MSTQYGEDEYILRYFAGRTGRFLDVGAGDGVTFSNTEPLLRAGWSGVMVEPSISQLRWLIENHGDNPAVEIIPAAVGCHPLDKFFDARDFSTRSSQHRERIEVHSGRGITFRERNAVGIEWGKFLGPFQFINVDAEGMNLELCETLPFASILPEMVCIEIDPEDALPRMTAILAEAGLSHKRRVGGNLLAARREIA